ncbi:hypothetical protein D3C87_1850670 [compost metagenome]
MAEGLGACPPFPLRVGRSRSPEITSTVEMSVPATSAKNRRRSSLTLRPSPIVADVATNRTFFGSTSNASITRRKRSATSAAAEPTRVWASSRMIHFNLPFD